MPNFKAKIHQIRFLLRIRPGPRWGSLQCSPRPLAVFKGPSSKGREERGGEAKGEEGKREGREEGRKGEGKEDKGRKGRCRDLPDKRQIASFDPELCIHMRIRRTANAKSHETCRR